METLDTLIQQHMDNQAALGATVAILQGGEIVYTGGFGITSTEDGGAKVTPQTLFAYGSISKNICAVLIMRLVEKRLLYLDTPIVHYLPDLQFSKNEEYGRRITLRHLLSHTSGLPNAGKYWGPRDPDSLRRSVYEQVAHYTFLSEPGAVHLYSNMVFCVAGHVAEAVTGRFYDDLVQEYVFDPLQMTRTTFDPSIAMTYLMALPHKSGPDGQPQVMHRLPHNGSGHPSSFALGPVSDLANLAWMYLNQGRYCDQQILTAASVAEMQKLHISRHIASATHPLAHPNGGFGLGFNVGHYKGRPAARHGGMNPGYNCFFDLFPDNRAGVVLLTTYLPDHEGELMKLVADLYDYALGLPQEGIVFLDKPAAISLLSDQLPRYGGAYLDIDMADLVTFVIIGDRLMLERGGDSWPLIPTGKNKFYAEVSEKYRLSVAFLFNANGKVAHVMIGGQPYHPIDMDLAFEPDLQLWQSFVGIYKDPSNMDEADILTVHLEDDVLFIAEGDDKVIGKAISNRCFLSEFELGLFEFEDTVLEGVKILVRGKATRYYPLNEKEFRANGIVRYLIDVPQYLDDVPVVQQRVQPT